MDIQEFLNTFGIDESSLTDKDKQKLINAIQNNKDAIAYGVYKKSSVDPISRKVFLDKYNMLKTKSPEQLMSEVIQGTVDNKNISNAMNYYLDQNAQLPAGFFDELKQKQEYIRPSSISYQMMSSISPSEVEAWTNNLSATDQDKPVAPDPPPGDDAATKQLQRNTLIDKFGSDMKSAPWTNAGIGASSIALSQMQGNGLVGTGVNLAAALGGSMAGEQYLGKALNNSTIARVGGGLAGHTIGNILMGLFRNPQEQQLLSQGMQYAQQNT